MQDIKIYIFIYGTATATIKQNFWFFFFVEKRTESKPSSVYQLIKNLRATMYKFLNLWWDNIYYRMIVIKKGEKLIAFPLL